MIEGIVNHRLEPTIRLVIRNAAGGDHEIEAFIDTGFAGALTLPRSVVAALNLPWSSRSTILLGDGGKVYSDVHAAIILWDGNLRHIRVEVADTLPLAGMKLIEGYDVHIEAVAGGRVVMEPLPAKK
jgi:clan AA aspartic protease